MGDWVGKFLAGLVILALVAAWFALKVYITSFFPPATEPHTLLGLALRGAAAIFACAVMAWIVWRKK